MPYAAMIVTRARFDVRRRAMKTGIFLGCVIPLAGCVQLTAPEKPIEINLNINIKQEVIVRLQKDAQEIITNNPELFPK